MPANMTSSHMQSVTATTKTASGHPPKKSAEEKSQDSLTLNSHLYAAPNVIERLGQGVTTSQKQYQAQVKTALATFDKVFYGNN